MKKRFMILCLLIIMSLCFLISFSTLFYVKVLSIRIANEQKENAIQYIKEYILKFDKELLKVRNR